MKFLNLATNKNMNPETTYFHYVHSRKQLANSLEGPDVTATQRLEHMWQLDVTNSDPVLPPLQQPPAAVTTNLCSCQ